MDKINTQSINNQVYNLLHKKIIKQELVSGQQINLRKIASEFNVSAMPVRDALLKLTNEGLIINKPRVGFFVRSFSIREIRDIMETRKMIELYCLNEYFEKIDRSRLEQILFQHEANDDTALPRDAFDRLDAKLHDCIIDASGNTFIKNQYNNLLSVFFLFRYLNLNRYHRAFAEHKKFIHWVIDNDRAQAADILKTHITGATEVIIQNQLAPSDGEADAT